MAAGSFNVYDVWKAQMGADSDMDSVTFMGVIVSAGYTPSLANDLSSTGMTTYSISSQAGTTSATSKALTNTEWSAVGSNTYKFDADDITYTYSVATHSKYFVVFRKSDNKLVGYTDLDTGASTGVEATKLIIQMPANGLFRLS
jgi:hypothetical protein